MLRDVLRQHPHLACPEETHFYRWAEPFGTEVMHRTLQGNATLKHHRGLDGISEEEFERLLTRTRSRKDLYRQYMELYIQRNKPGATRWFDKTPQNVYGAFLAASQFPFAKFIHIVRHPVNVAASLRLGKVMKVNSLVGSINYWNESVAIIKALRTLYPKRVHELRYEDFTADPEGQTRSILNFLKEPVELMAFDPLRIKAVDHAEEGVLSLEEMREVCTHCAAGLRRYAYRPPEGVTLDDVPEDSDEDRAP